jgi:acetamidase/formamidase
LSRKLPFDRFTRGQLGCRYAQVALISLGVDFGITQVADGNWGVHAIVRKKMFG